MSCLHPKAMMIGLAVMMSVALCANAQENGIAVNPASMTPAKKAALQWVDDNSRQLASWNDQIWGFAEIALQEFKSSALLADQLERAGFKVARGVSGMPTAFIAEYGSGRPVIGILAEYDALPTLSQKVSPTQEPVQAGAPGHGCGHNAFAAGSVGAAIALKDVMAREKIPGTIRLYGTPAEENYSGKTYMARDGAFDDLSVALHWHPGTMSGVTLSSNFALNGVEIEFFGKTAHAAGAPWDGRSALDAAELTNVAMNYLREHVKPTARIHYVTLNGGAAANIVPEYAKLWYMVRDQDRQSVEYLYQRLLKCAEGATLQTETTFKVHVLEGTWNLLVNEAGSKIMYSNLLLVGSPRFTEQEQAFARTIQKEMKVPEKGLAGDIEPLQRAGPPEGGSTDVSDVSWIAPTIGLSVALAPIGAPGHHWSTVACGGMSIGHKSAITAAKAIAATALDLIQNPELLQRVAAEWKEKTKGIPYKSAIPKGQNPPVFQPPAR
jgi:aminobenzoyl-glutamate utilization protein B